MRNIIIFSVSVSVYNGYFRVRFR